MDGKVEIDLKTWEDIMSKLRNVTNMEINHARENASLIYKLGFSQSILTEWSVFMSNKFDIVEQDQIENLVAEYNKFSSVCNIIIDESPKGIAFLPKPKDPEAEQRYVRKHTKDLQSQS